MTSATRIGALGMMVVCLAACQNSAQVVDGYKILQSVVESKGVTKLSCGAKLGCDFERIDDVAVIDEETKRPTATAIEQGLVRIEGSVFSPTHEYALSITEGDHEIAVRFYPVSVERAERFHLIHNFQAKHRYQLQMYRQRDEVGQSLLSVATPGKLCVDLLQDQIALRRFCRDHDVMTGLGEFIEQDI